MRIDELTLLDQAIEEFQGQKAEGRGQNNQNATCDGFHLSTETDAVSISSISALCPHPSALIFFIGPEGGWTEDELRLFSHSGLTGLKLTATILRIETAAVATAAIASIILANSAAKKT
jgi:RsmE family RNA methyltransferase